LPWRDYVFRRHSKDKYCFGMPVSAEPMAAKSPAIRLAPPPEAASFGKAHALVDGEYQG
jgi:hypothetical protein